MSIINVLVAVAILSVITAGTASLINTTFKGVRGIEVRHGLGEVQRKLYNLLERAENCTFNFGETVVSNSNDLGRAFNVSDFPRNITKLTNRDTSGSIINVFEESQSYEENRVVIESIELTALQPASSLPTEQMISTVIITMSSTGEVIGPNRFRRSIDVRFVLDSPYNGGNNPNVQSCYSVGGTANQLWSKSSLQKLNYNGLVGIGVDDPTSALEVNGASRNTSAIQNTTSRINFDTSNIQYTGLTCRNFDLWNLKEGGAYTFIVQNTSSATCSFNAYSGNGTNALNVHLPSGHGPTEDGEHTIYTIIVAGNHAYFAWVTQFD